MEGDNMAEDYIMRQVNAVGRGFGNVLATALHLKRSNVDLGQFEDENGELIPRNDYLNDLLKHQKFHEVFLFIDKLKYKLSYFEFTMICDDFLQILIYLTPEQKTKFDIDDTTVNYYKQRFIEP